MANVNNLPRHSKTAEQILSERGISLSSFTIRRQYTVCPKCSSDRKKKKAECLAVTIEHDRVYWACNHCGDKGYEFYEEKQDLRPRQLEVHYQYTATLRKVRTSDKRFYWQHLENNCWVKGTGGQTTKDLLYRYDEVKTAIDKGQPIAVVEGEKDVDNLWKISIPATCNAHGAGKWSTALRDGVANAIVVIFPDYDKPGIDHAETILKSIKTTTKAAKIVNLKDHWETIPESGDISDYIAAGFDVPKLWKSVSESFADVRGHSGHSDHDDVRKAQTGNGHTTLSDDEIEAMAAMGAIELAQTIKKLAADKGVPQQAIKSEYKARKDELGIETKTKRRRFEIPETEPWPDPVNGEELANELSGQARRFLVLPSHASVIIALWTICSYAPRIYRITPRLQVTAPEKRCGKTTLLNFLHEVVYRRVKTGNVSTAAFFRIVEGHHPTLLIDEMDTFMNKDEDIRNVLNEGHEINGCVIRCEKIADNFEPVPFSCFAPVAYAHIGKLPKDMGMLLDRSISIHLARRMASEAIDRIDQIKDNEFLPLRQKIKRWSMDHEEEIRNANPDLSGVNDRVRDNWRPLLAIAYAIGGPWPDLALAAVANPDDDGSYGEMVLADLQAAFDSARVDFMFSAHICAFLNALEDRPWSEWGVPPKELSPKALAKLMREFEIQPARDPTKSGRGYYRSQLQPLWDRYLSGNGRARDHIPQQVSHPSPEENNVDKPHEKWDGMQKPQVSQVSHVSDADPDDWQFNQ